MSTELKKLCDTVECISEDVALIKDNMIGNKMKNIPSMIDRQNEHHEWIEKQKNKLTIKKFFTIIFKAIST